MITKEDLKLAGKKDVRKIKKLFRAINKKIHHKEIIEKVKEKKLYILKDKKRIKAAFSFTVIGIVGYFAIMWVSKLAVAPELQGSGIGTFMLNRIKKMAKNMGVAAFLLFSANRTKGFYRKNKLSNIWRFFWWRRNNKI